MLRWIFVFAFLVSCSNDKSNDKNESDVSRSLKIQSINDSCLNLQMIISQMDSSAFSFPGIVYTQDFQILSAVQSPAFAEGLYARSWQNERREISAINDLRGLTQHECESLSLPNFNAIRLPYTITAFSKTHLEFELDRKTLEESLADLPKDQRKAVLEFPGVRKYSVEVQSPNSLEVTSYYETVPTICSNEATPEIREVVVYDWSEAPSLMVAPTYWRKLGTLSQLTSEPPAFRENDDTSLIPIDSDKALAMTSALEGRSYANCF